MDQADRYRQLALLGKEVFLASAAPAALIRRRAEDSEVLDRTGSGDKDLDAETQVAAAVGRRRAPGGIEVFPLAKKPGASFPDMITIGRTANNDIVLRDVTVSRLHAFFRRRDDRWVVADAGSKNGTAVEGEPLLPRRERDVGSGTGVRIGDLELTFYTAVDLYAVLSGK
ncbi:MAG: FHA domain-containing protein [Deltaproteobacteria bacterium]|nr:FHA domain-containing protein [Deltaproteobacteria bacterium]